MEQLNLKPRINIILSPSLSLSRFLKPDRIALPIYLQLYYNPSSAQPSY